MLSAAADEQGGVRRRRKRRNRRPADGRGVRPGRRHLDNVACPSAAAQRPRRGDRRRASRGGRRFVRGSGGQERGGDRILPRKRGPVCRT